MFRGFARGNDANGSAAVALTVADQQKVSAWGDMPAWVPGTGDTAGFGLRSNRRAVAAGLTFRPLATTAKDALAWWKEQPEDRRAKPRAGIAPDREAQVLAAWKAKKA